ncbi:uncharacterized protein HMPREF1541_07754 [Cyphellophora europaea CBS 101466]|uniref:tRNA (guanine(9)-N1)-methyltransferase n=1 Tax=Cyphellophora europaea (strain CBS 101466) TaxID=1220924 RepID=W2RP80_CYPE1|nr:uncharacterized protein HMPREF1541_07754 [Cyphellophora europaea CBS 101466]ETN38130.1 hypothetical protein HMPREF1541_07754 [Cyphellophora europaea CBS 101466]
MAEGRPTKLRKLSHTNSGGDGVDVASNDSGSPDIVVDEDVDQSRGPEDGTNEAPEANGTSPDQNGEAKSMSKNQLKKLRKRQEWEAGRDYRKAKRKQKAKEKKERKRASKEERRVNGVLEEPQSRKPRNPVQLPITFIIDCGFDDLMMEKEMISLGSQITRAYSDNSRSTYQAHIAVSSWGGKLRERFDTRLSGNYKKWRGITFLEEDFVDVAERATRWMADPKRNKMAGAFLKHAKPQASQESQASKESIYPSEAGRDEEDVQPKPDEHDDSSSKARQEHKESDRSSAGQPESAQKESDESNGTTAPNSSQAVEGEIIYLSSDSQFTLEELKPNSTYIIGGLVDKNRHKGICHKIAGEKGVRTAKLPIGEYMEMQSRSVLATNHVNEIMLRWLECGDWGQAFMQVIPKRKGGKLRDQDDDAADARAADDDDGMDDVTSADGENDEGVGQPVDAEPIQDDETTGETSVLP